MRGLLEHQEFRASWPIRGAVLSALLIWLGIGALAAAIGEMPMAAVASIAFFVVVFLVFVAYYWSMVYVVDEYGLTYRGATEFEHFSWEDIDHVRRSEIPLGGYYITTKSGSFVLSDFVRGKDRLVELIIARAGLFPSA